MEGFYLISYTYREGLNAQDRKEMAQLFATGGEAPGVVAHYARLDGRGGFMIQKQLQGEELKRDFEQTVSFSPFMTMEMHGIVSIEEAFPVFQRVFG